MKLFVMLLVVLTTYLSAGWAFDHNQTGAVGENVRLVVSFFTGSGQVTGGNDCIYKAVFERIELYNGGNESYVPIFEMEIDNSQVYCFDAIDCFHFNTMDGLEWTSGQKTFQYRVKVFYKNLDGSYTQVSNPFESNEIIVVRDATPPPSSED